MVIVPNLCFILVSNFVEIKITFKLASAIYRLSSLEIIKQQIQMKTKRFEFIFPSISYTTTANEIFNIFRVVLMFVDLCAIWSLLKFFVLGLWLFPEEYHRILSSIYFFISVKNIFY